jgi:osmotically-inducible protein OsmY
MQILVPSALPAAETNKVITDIGITSVDDSGVTIDPRPGAGGRRQFKDALKSDSDIKLAVQGALRLDPRVSAFSPDVSVEGGVVVLGGNVRNFKAKTSAEQDAMNIVGVLGVDNFLKVKPKAETTDAEMQRELKAALYWDPLLDNSTIDVAVINRVAYLSGALDSSFQKTEAQDVASREKACCWFGIT